jgi:hypothetical protein
MKIGYADPPYPGRAQRTYGRHPDYAGEVDHAELVARLEAGYDAWVLHTAASTLQDVLAVCPPRVRILAWVKPFASWKPNQWPAWAWEPVILCGGRNRFGEDQTPRDWLPEPIATQRGLAGAKPYRVVAWALNCLGALPEDELDDLYPGTGAVLQAWQAWRDQTRIPLPPKRDERAQRLVP